MSESASQKSVINWFRMARHQLGVPDSRLLFSIPNGSYLGKDRVGAAINCNRLKAEGLLPGAPDLILAVARNGYHGLFIEMKAGKGRTSPEQIDVNAMLIKQGYACVTAHSTDEAISIISGYCA